MESSKVFSKRAAGVVALAALLAGCSSSGSPSAAPQGAASRAALAANGFGVKHAAATRAAGRVAQPDKKAKGLIYSGNYDSDTIYAYSSKGHARGPLWQITEGLSSPERLFVDKKLNLYASNAGNNTIVAYAPFALSPELTISDGVNVPTGLVVGGDGTVYVANVGNETVTEYAAGATVPSLTINLSGYSPENLAVDKSNNLYIQYLGGNRGSGVIEVPPGQTSGTDLDLTVGSAGAVEVDRKGNVIVLDTSVPAVDIFPPGKTSPSSQIDITSGSPFELSLSKTEKKLYVSVESGLSFLVQVTDYPNGTSFSTKFTSEGDWPLAVSPDNAL